MHLFKPAALLLLAALTAALTVADPSTASTAPVKESGLEFVLTAPTKVQLPGHKDPTLKFTLTVTNKSDSDINLALMHAVTINLKDANGKTLPQEFSEVGKSRYIPPMFVPKNAGTSITRLASLGPDPNNAGKFILSGAEPTGGNWSINGIAAGKYTLSMTYSNNEKTDQKTPLWVGTATTKELTLELAK